MAFAIRQHLQLLPLRLVGLLVEEDVLCHRRRFCLQRGLLLQDLEQLVLPLLVQVVRVEGVAQAEVRPSTQRRRSRVRPLVVPDASLTL